MSDIPDGKYRGKAVGPVTLIESENKGTPGVTVDMEFQTQEGVLERLSWTGWLSEGAANRTFESLRLMGWKGNDIDNVTGLDQEVEVVVEAEEHEGKWYPRIRWINRIGGALGGAMTGEKKRAFAEAMKARIQAFDAAKKTPKSTQASEPPHTADTGFEPPF